MEIILLEVYMESKFLQSYFRTIINYLCNHKWLRQSCSAKCRFCGKQSALAGKLRLAHPSFLSTHITVLINNGILYMPSLLKKEVCSLTLRN